MSESFSFQELRMQKDLELNAVSREISINQSILEKIEAGKFREIGAPVFVRGYIYMYARFLGVSEDKIDAFVNQLEFGCDPDLRLSEANIESQSKSYRRSNASLWLTMAACVVGIVTIAYQLLNSNSWLKTQLNEAFPKQAVTVEAPVTSNVQMNNNEPVVNIDASEPEPIAAESTATAVTPAAPAIQLESAADMPPATSNPVALEGLTSMETPEEPTANKVPTEGFNLTWTGRAWIKITDKNGVVTGDKIFSKGHSFTLPNDKAPYTINIRRPQDVKITVGENTIDWKNILNSDKSYSLKVIE